MKTMIAKELKATDIPAAVNTVFRQDLMGADIGLPPYAGAIYKYDPQVRVGDMISIDDILVNPQSVDKSVYVDLTAISFTQAKGLVNLFYHKKIRQPEFLKLLAGDRQGTTSYCGDQLAAYILRIYGPQVFIELLEYLPAFGFLKLAECIPLELLARLVNAYKYASIHFSRRVIVTIDEIRAHQYFPWQRSALTVNPCFDNGVIYREVLRCRDDEAADCCFNIEALRHRQSCDWRITELLDLQDEKWRAIAQYVCPEVSPESFFTGAESFFTHTAMRKHRRRLQNTLTSMTHEQVDRLLVVNPNFTLLEISRCIPLSRLENWDLLQFIVQRSDMHYYFVPAPDSQVYVTPSEARKVLLHVLALQQLVALSF